MEWINCDRFAASDILMLNVSAKKLAVESRTEVQLLQDLMHLSVSAAHFTLCIPVVSARRPASSVRTLGSQYGRTR